MAERREAVSTAGLSRPIEFWHDVVCQSFTALSTDPVGHLPFAGEIVAERRIGGNSLSTISASAQLVQRTRNGVAQRPSESVFVNVQLAGHCAVRVGDFEALLAPGDIVVLDADAPFSMRFDRSFRQACLHLQGVTDQTRDALSRTVLRGSNPAAGQIAGELDIMRHDAGAHDVPLSVTALLATEAGHIRRRDLSVQHLSLIKRHIAECSDDRELDPGKVARHFRISKRHLHNLFAQSGETFGQYLLLRRTQRARARIDRRPDIAIGQIARDSGFISVSHFSRVFARQFGITPRNWRQASRKQWGEGS